MGSPTNAVIGNIFFSQKSILLLFNFYILGLFMLWWGWLSFNAGSTFGISGNKWRLSAKVIEKEL